MPPLFVVYQSGGAAAALQVRRWRGSGGSD